jgi:hypothetical protein
MSRMEHCATCDRSFTPYEMAHHIEWHRKQEKEPEIAAGRSWPALRESKVFDAERLSEMPLFDRRLF